MLLLFLYRIIKLVIKSLANVEIDLNELSKIEYFSLIVWAYFLTYFLPNLEVFPYPIIRNQNYSRYNGNLKRTTRKSC